MFERINVIVLDSVGIGGAPDAGQYGDKGSDTVGHIFERFPESDWSNLIELGLANTNGLLAHKAVRNPKGFYGRMRQKSIGKDSMTGHWELMGIVIDREFPNFLTGFPADLIQKIEEYSGRTVLCNKGVDGYTALDEYGKKQVDTGGLIVYTSNDSVLQVAAHEDVVPKEELYRICEYIRTLANTPPLLIGRIIARPFVGEEGSYERLRKNRHDYTIKPFQRTVLEELEESRLEVITIGKVDNIFSGIGITETNPTETNLEGIQKNIEVLKRGDWQGLLFTNLVDFDTVYGHKRDVKGYAEAIEEFDSWLPEIMGSLTAKDLLIVTADHGNDPTHTGASHTREDVPLLIYSPRFKKGRDIGLRESFTDLAATVAENFKVNCHCEGKSFLEDLTD